MSEWLESVFGSTVVFFPDSGRWVGVRRRDSVSISCVSRCTGDVECTSFVNKVAERILTANAGLVRWSSRFVCPLFFWGTDKQASGTPVGDGG